VRPLAGAVRREPFRASTGGVCSKNPPQVSNSLTQALKMMYFCF
jgi:hypothetical protein